MGQEQKNETRTPLEKRKNRGISFWRVADRMLSDLMEHVGPIKMERSPLVDLLVRGAYDLRVARGLQQPADDIPAEAFEGWSVRAGLISQDEYQALKQHE